MFESCGKELGCGKLSHVSRNLHLGLSHDLEARYLLSAKTP
jgi:hypothetical protein